MHHSFKQRSFYKLVKILAFAGFLFMMSTNLHANEYKEAVKNSTLLIATNNEDVIKGLAKSIYNVTPYKVIDYLPSEIPDNVIHYEASYSYYYTGITLMLRYKKANYTIANIRWNRPLKSASDFRALYNHFDQLVREYLLYADDKGQVDISKVQQARKKDLVALADNLTKTTYYADNETSSENIKKWDKKKGKVKRTSGSELSRVIEAAEDTNGYYIITEKKNKMLWISGFFTVGAGFIVAPFIPKYQTTVYSTNSDKSLGTFRMYNPTSKATRVQKKLSKFKSKK